MQVLLILTLKLFIDTGKVGLLTLKIPSVALKVKQLLPTSELPITIILKFKSYLAFLSFIISILSSFFFGFGGLLGSNGVKYPESSPSDFLLRYY